MNILVCDDERDIVDAIEIYLRDAGFDVLKAYDGEEALAQLKQNEVHLVILDVMMPKLDGIHAMTRIRRDFNIPVIILSAKSEDTDKITGLSLGADDYITKPFKPSVLMARVKSQLRRYTELGGAEPRRNTYKTGGLVLNDDLKTVSVDGEDVRMTPVQYRILLLLMKNIGRVFSINEIYERVWNEMPYNADNTVAVHIRNIREKIEINPKEPKYLKVVWGIGYKIERL
ncbi:MAG: response regulator transcription factor [Oscillospiraceae bacterium]|jgi:DNA-binding response OmpR family regulator|nr:response regulator transcription factor [Oscillospiraceae bacterium]